MPAPLLTLLVYVTVALCWSGSWITGKLGVALIPPLELSTVRFALAGLLMLAIARVMQAPLGLAKLPLVALAGAFGIFGYKRSSSWASRSHRQAMARSSCRR